MATTQLAALGVGLALLLTTRAVRADDRPKGHEGHAAGDKAVKYDHCAQACNDCARVCDACVTHCANRLSEGRKDHYETLRTCQDCATICRAAATITARIGPFGDAICTACADVCGRCAKACEKFSDDEHLRTCARECRRCEKECRGMLEGTQQSRAAR